jgi:hypothetical protein
MLLLQQMGRGLHLSACGELLLPSRWSATAVVRVLLASHPGLVGGREDGAGDCKGSLDGGGSGE